MTDATQKVRDALNKIASWTQTEGLLWWQIEARAALAALDAPAEGEAKVRELSWFKPDSRNTLSRAETAFGVYRVWTHHEANGRWFWSLDGYEKRSGDVASEAEGFSAAQADYERRIRSELVKESRS
jgi:hypothetical protein